MSVKNCTRLYYENKIWKIRRVKSREKKEFRAVLHKIARQIVGFADSSCAGIKFEKIFPQKYLHHRQTEEPYRFSFENGSFVTLIHLVEKHALRRGIPVLYVNPSHTSTCCSRCGCRGKRIRKRFECPRCGLVMHADVNAAYNIAAASHFADKTERRIALTARKNLRKLVRVQPVNIRYTCTDEHASRQIPFIAGIPKDDVAGGPFSSVSSI